MHIAYCHLPICLAHCLLPVAYCLDKADIGRIRETHLSKKKVAINCHQTHCHKATFFQKLLTTKISRFTLH